MQQSRTVKRPRELHRLGQQAFIEIYGGSHWSLHSPAPILACDNGWSRLSGRRRRIRLGIDLRQAAAYCSAVNYRGAAREFDHGSIPRRSAAFSRTTQQPPRPETVHEADSLPLQRSPASLCWASCLSSARACSPKPTRCLRGTTVRPRQAIVEFVQTTTTQGSPNFVPPEARIATFDQDGTLWVSHPMYTQVVYCLDRVGALVKAKPELAKVEPFKTVVSGDREAIAKLSRRTWRRSSPPRSPACRSRNSMQK